MNLLQFLVDDLPLGVDYALKVVDVADSNFGIFLLRLQLQFYLKDDDFGVDELLRLLLEPRVRERLLECHPAHQERVLYRPARHLLYPDQLFVQEVSVQLLDR